MDFCNCRSSSRFCIGTIYINDLVDKFSSEAKLFADDTSLFSVVYDEKVAAEKLNKDLETMSKWAHQWKTQFNPDKNKQAVQVTFSYKSPKSPHPPLYFKLSRGTSCERA